ncbi:MAG: hypothetical protein AAFV43_05040 [Planctomycetota bacterium]
MKAALSLLFVSVLAVSPAHANLLSNASFESQIDYSGTDPNNWLPFFGGGSQGTTSTVDAGYTGVVMPSDGVNHLSMINATAQDGFSGILQSFPAVEGLDYTFAFEAKANGAYNIASEYRIEWLDAAGGFVGGQFDLNTGFTPTATYATQSITATAPAGAVTGTAVIAIQTFIPAPPGGAGDFFGDLFVDNASVTSNIPEPSAAVLGLLGIAGLARRRH